ncbi:MAG: hypothetical protein ACI865_003473 [Flavobacteriaceae bacterium]|jgi:hypothetical protein
MKFALSIIALLTINSFSYAQQNFVEVIVQEEIELKATEFTTILSNKPGMENWMDAVETLEEYDEFDEAAPAEEGHISEPDITLDQLKNLLSKEKFTYKVVLSVENPDPEYTQWKIEVTLPTLDEVARLEKRLESEVGVHVEQGDIRYESLDIYLPKIYPMMQEKAKQRGLLLASAAGKKLGDVQQITEGNGRSSNLFDSENYMDLVMGMINRDKNQMNLTKSETISLIYRFALN